LPVYRELAAAGIMEPVPGSESEYRFTEEGMAHREAILEREADRIERERYEPPDAGELSEPARELLRTCIEQGYPEGDETNRPAYRITFGEVPRVYRRIVPHRTSGRRCADHARLTRAQFDGQIPSGWYVLYAEFEA
jgi:hypothetical protein